MKLWVDRLIWIAILMIVAITFLNGCGGLAWGDSIITDCSYYTVASTIKEKTGNGIGLTASGEILKDDGEYTFAHATLPFGSRVRITRLDREDLSGNPISIIARCNDRGPSAKCRRNGRQIDVNRSSAAALGILESGHTLVKAELLT